MLKTLLPRIESCFGKRRALRVLRHVSFRGSFPNPVWQFVNTLPCCSHCRGTPTRNWSPISSVLPSQLQLNSNSQHIVLIGRFRLLSYWLSVNQPIRLEVTKRARPCFSLIEPTFEYRMVRTTLEVWTTRAHNEIHFMYDLSDPPDCGKLILANFILTSRKLRRLSVMSFQHNLRVNIDIRWNW